MFFFLLITVNLFSLFFFLFMKVIAEAGDLFSTKSLWIACHVFILKIGHFYTSFAQLRPHTSYGASMTASFYACFGVYGGFSMLMFKYCSLI